MSIILGIDFDGTCVDHRFPEVGEDVPDAAYWLKKYVEEGARLILLTMRSHGQKNENVLNDAVFWFTKHDIPLWAINDNPEQQSWAALSRKVYAHCYIDDANACCPLIENPRSGGRPYVDWSIVGPSVMGIVKKSNKAICKKCGNEFDSIPLKKYYPEQWHIKKCAECWKRDIDEARKAIAEGRYTLL